jgi:hypothetical protein
VQPACREHHMVRAGLAECVRRQPCCMAGIIARRGPGYLRGFGNLARCTTYHCAWDCKATQVSACSDKQRHHTACAWFSYTRSSTLIASMATSSTHCMHMGYLCRAASAPRLCRVRPQAPPSSGLTAACRASSHQDTTAVTHEQPRLAVQQPKLHR